MALNIEQRLQDVADNIQKSETLLKSFEDALRLEDDPRRRMRYEQEIQQIKSSITQYWHEYQQLEQTQPITNTHEAPVAGSSMLDLNYEQRSRLSQFLTALPSPQFEQLVFILNPPPNNIPPSTIPQASRVAFLLQWAESPIGCSLTSIVAILQLHFQFEEEATA